MLQDRESAFMSASDTTSVIMSACAALASNEIIRACENRGI